MEPDGTSVPDGLAVQESAPASAPEPAPSPSRWRIAAAVVASLLLLYPVVMLAPFAALPFVRATVAKDHGWFQYDNEEGALLFQTLELRAGRSIYRPLDDYPLAVGTYPPLFMLINAPFADREQPSFFAGRIITAGSAMGIALMIAAIIALRWRNAAAALAGAGLFLATYEVYNWIAYYRVDLPALFLSVMGLGCVAVSPARDRAARVLSIVLFALAFYTKQTSLAAPLAATVYYLACDRRGGLRYALWLAAAILLPFAALSAATGGQFAIHTVRYNMNTFVASDLLVWTRHVLLFYPWLLGAAGLALAGIAWCAVVGADGHQPCEASGGDAAQARRPALPVLLYALFALGGFLAIGKTGSAENYLLEPLAAVALLTADGFARLTAHVLRGRLAAVALAGAVGVAALLTVHVSRVSALQPIMFSPLKNPTRMDFSAAAAVARDVEGAAGDSWTELGMFNLLAGRSIHMQPFIMSELARQGMVTLDKFHADVRARRFGVIVTNHDLASGDGTIVYTTETLALLREHYAEASRQTDGHLWKYYLYKPRPRSQPRHDIVTAPAGDARSVAVAY